MITKKQAETVVTAEDERAIKALADKVDRAIEEYDGAPVRVDLPSGVRAKVVSAIITMYSTPEAGWMVKRERGSDQRGDEGWDYLSFT